MAELIEWLWHRMSGAVGIVMAPWHSMHDPIKHLLNTDEQEADLLTAKWVGAKLAEHNYIGITSALVASVVVGASSWYSAESDPWTTRALWSSALVFSMTSIALATQQSIALNRMSSYENSLRKVRQMLGEDNPRYVMEEPHSEYIGQKEKVLEGRRRMRRSQLYLWQTPVMLSNFAILMFVVGLFIKIFRAAVASRGSWLTGDMQVAIFFGCASIFAVANYLLAWLCLNRSSLG